MDPSLLVGGREAGGKSISADGCLARIEKYDIVRHYAEQADKVACVNGSDPRRVHLADGSFLRSHLPPLPANNRLCRGLPAINQTTYLSKKRDGFDVPRPVCQALPRRLDYQAKS
jgi:hypothetical protein